MRSNTTLSEITSGQASDSDSPLTVNLETPPGQQIPGSLDPGPLVGVPVLIVDDNEVIHWVLNEFATGWRMRPTVVKDAPAAIAAMERADRTNGPFPLVLLSPNIRNSNMVVEYLRQHPTLARTTIVLLSSIHAQNEMTRCRNLNVAAYLTKPVKHQELLDTLLTTLTRNAQFQQEPALQENPDIAGACLRILLVDDNPVNRKISTAMLEHMGHTVEAVANGREALSQYATGNFELILMDILMPEMDGFAVTRAIRESERAGDQHIPIIALTACETEENHQRCLEAGMDGFISKPVQASALAAEMVCVLLARGRTIQPR